VEPKGPKANCVPATMFKHCQFGCFRADLIDVINASHGVQETSSVLAWDYLLIYLFTYFS
jgi:hypothetical protein